ncbi:MULTISPECIES: TetR family transcriptional regulator [unclassified Planococcus (in: firmicutes)]|uniref:TetR family transcriptional regulator n=1 Tax=unclassified Planococcus (in: firmicutes) TaxID=2662419 RepID=UPI0020B26776|nr:MULTISPECIES: TetR family transcriptional regulator [unclassified Planococcus (in: firmicutes)]
MAERIEEQVLYAVEKKETGSVQIVDADWTENDGLAIILETRKQSWIQLNGVDIKLGFQRNFHSIRWIDSANLIVSALSDHPTRESSKLEQFIINREGKIMNTFYAGEYVADQVACKEGIWFSYYDEGIFGGGIETEGLLLKDLSGMTLFRYHSDLLDRPDIGDCYAICKGKGRELWLFPYSTFQLVAVDPHKRGLWLFNVPEILHGSSGLCVRGAYTYFYNPYDSNGKLYQLKIGTSQLELLGTFSGRLRGMPPSEQAHFISIEENTVKLFKILNKDEYIYS